MLVCVPFHSIANAPVGLAYLGAWLEKHGVECPLRDLNIEGRQALLEAARGPQGLPGDAEVVPQLFALARRTYLAEALVWSWLDPGGTEELVARVLAWPDAVQREFWRDQGIERLAADPALVRAGERLRSWLDARAAELARVPRWLGFSTVITNLPATLYLLREVRRRAPHLFLVIGGPYVTPRSATALLRAAPELNAAVPLPAYAPLLELLRGVVAERCTLVPGTWQRIGGRLEADPRRVETPLDEVPPARWRDLPMPLYVSGFQLEAGPAERGRFYPTVPIETSRGCSYSRCTFCHNVVDHKKYRMRHPQRVAAEIAHQRATVGSDGFFFTDDEFGGSERQTAALCEALAEYDLRWFCWVRLDTVDRPFLERIYRAGARQLFLGVEAVEDSLLAAYRKGYGAAEALARLRGLHEFWEDHPDFLYHFNLISNHPKETVDAVRGTLALVAAHPELFVGRLAACCSYHLYEATPDFARFQSLSRPCLDPVLPPGVELPSFRWLLPQHDPATAGRRYAIWDAIGELTRFRGASADSGAPLEQIVYD